MIPNDVSTDIYTIFKTDGFKTMGEYSHDRDVLSKQGGEQSSGIGQFLFLFLYLARDSFECLICTATAYLRTRIGGLNAHHVDALRRKRDQKRSPHRPDRRFPPRARLSDSRNNYPCELRTKPREFA